MTTISRELCRRLSLPTLIQGLTAMAPLFKIVDHGDYVSIILMSRGEPLHLRFSDENTAAEEGFNIAKGKFVSEPREVPVCVGKRCRPGCGCGCARDLGYTDKGFMAVSLGESTCTTAHVGPLPPRAKDPRLFTLDATKKTVASLLTMHIQALIDSGVRVTQ